MPVERRRLRQVVHDADADMVAGRHPDHWPGHRPVQCPRQHALSLHRLPHDLPCMEGKVLGPIRVGRVLRQLIPILLGCVGNGRRWRSGGGRAAHRHTRGCGAARRAAAGSSATAVERRAQPIPAQSHHQQRPQHQDAEGRGEAIAPGPGVHRGPAPQGPPVLQRSLATGGSWPHQRTGWLGAVSALLAMGACQLGLLQHRAGGLLVARHCVLPPCLG
jgi:hypothetical protein